ncbi:GNAT family N-acetyltransferase [Thalassobacillus hwangdonensis]|uniref:GNAT family N-acetyltransferase n=1 Tax=Thalassobacillus hwangdonensis TaxID=546108 RepID=A0ABW3L683_9BACI
MGYKLFHSNQKAMWHHYLNQIEQKDIYFTPEYCEVHERNGEGKATLFIYEEAGKFVYYPFLLRKVNDLPFFKNRMGFGGDIYDLTTPYGYGGPITNAGVEDQTLLFYNFSKVFREFCLENRIVTEFIRFHPVISNHALDPTLEPLYLRNTIAVDLTCEEETIWSNYDSPNRNRIRKATSNGLSVVHKPLTDRSNFMRIYYSTMKKNNASSYYYFSGSYFQNKADLLGENAELLEVMHEGRAIFSGIFMSYGDFVHYDLVGSDQNYLKLCPNNFVIDYAAKWAKENGKMYLHLGGGYTGDDQLYRFKKRFNKYGDLPFYIGKRIHDEALYEAITEGLPKNDSYFPLYRHPDLVERKKETVG